MQLYMVVLAATMICQEGESPQRSFISEGSRLPDFDLKTLEGAPFSSKSLAGKMGILVFLRPDQSYSSRVLRDLGLMEEQLPGISWSKIVVFSGDVSEKAVRKMVKAEGFTGTLLLDPDRVAYAKFDVVAVPSAAIFDKELRVIYSRPGFGIDFVSQVVKHVIKSTGRSLSIKDHSPARIELGRRLIAKGHLDKAEAVLREALAEKSSLQAYLLLGAVLLQGGKPDEALQVIQEARKKFPEDHSLEILRARALAALGKNDEAKKILILLLPRLPLCWEVHEVLAEVHENLGQKDQAIQEYKKAISILKRESRER